MNFKIFIGIDQTGAISSNGMPKHLDACIIDHTSPQPKIFTGLKLKKLDYLSLQNLIKQCIPHFKNQKVLVCVDTVIGLPLISKTSLSKIFSKIKNYSFNGKSYGAVTAHQFFGQFLFDAKSKHRQVEIKARSNNVFDLMPFQRNIGCGSYRVLKELSEDRSWFNVWPFEKLATQFLIAEGYPSYLWKTLFKTKKRDLPFLAQQFKSIKLKTADEADSFVLAYGASKFARQLSKPVPTIAKKEGWMLGVPFKD